MNNVKKLFILVVVFSSFIVAFKGKPVVYAWECGDCGGGCYPLSDSLENNENWCSKGDPCAKRARCNEHNRGGCVCDKGGPITCTNVAYVCPDTCEETTETPTPTVCSCSPVGCPSTGENKFKQLPVPSGVATVCSADNCSMTHPTCFVNTNSPPSCSMLPTSIEMTREDASKIVSITTTDADWGDSVSVRSVKVVDIHGALKSCVDIKTLAGGSLDNAELRSGSNNSAATSQTVQFKLDAQTANGIYERVSNGPAICEGKVEIEIVDVGDTSGDAPTFPYPKCSMNIKVTDEAPKLSNVTILDRDEHSYNRDAGALSDGNLVDGRIQLFVGSSLVGGVNKSRASYCGESLSIIDPIRCPLGGEYDRLKFSQRRNPLLLEYTVTDANGFDDIIKSGVWVQRSSQNRNNAVTPEISSGKRNSFQILYSESEISQLTPASNNLLCFSQGAVAPSVINSSVCSSDCAACIKKEGITKLDNNSLRFKLGLYFNDKDGGQGMTDEEYSIFVSALDKVNVPLYNVAGKGTEGWLKFTRNGLPCTAASCSGNSDFSLLFDPVAPTATYITWETVDLTKINAKFSLSDKTGGSGLAGVTNRFIVTQEMLDNEPLGPRTWAKKLIEGTDFDGKGDFEPSTSALAILSGKGLGEGDGVIAGLCVYDKAGNMGCKSNNDVPYVFLAPWIKTSYGDIYSTKGGIVPFSQSLPTEDLSSNDNTRSLYVPFTKQVFSLGTGMIMTGGAITQGLGVNGGHLVGGVNMQLGFEGNYRQSSTTSNYNVYGFTPFSPGNEYERLRATALLNCDLSNSITAGVTKCQNGGGLSSIGEKAFNLLYLNNIGNTGDILCSHTNVLFVTGMLTIKGSVTKDSRYSDSGCIFILANGASLSIDDNPSDNRKYTRTPPPSGELGTPMTDKFDAAIVANSGASVRIMRGLRGTSTKSTDRLEINGWVYSSNTLPLFSRDLAPVDNKRYPSEYIIYDAKLLDLFRPLLGVEKTVDLTCGTSDHVLCKTAN